MNYTLFKTHTWSNIKPFQKPTFLAQFVLAKNIANIYPKSNFIGIASLVNEASLSQACLKVLSQKYECLVANPKLDPNFGILDAILKIRPNTKKVILEMLINYPEDMNYFLSIVKPKTAVISRLFFSQNDFFNDFDKLLKGMEELVDSAPEDGHIILNWDDVYARRFTEKTKAKVLYYGLDPATCDIWAGNIRLENFYTQFELNHKVERVSVDFKPLGRHQVYCALAAAAVGVLHGMSLVNIKKGLESVETGEHKMSVCEGYNGSVVLDDTADFSPVTFYDSLAVLSEVPARRRIIIMGELKDVINQRKLYQKIAQRMYKEKVDLIFLGVGETKFIKDELINLGFMPERIEIGQSNGQIVASLLRILGRGDVLLVKGSKSSRFDEVVKRVTKQ